MFAITTTKGIASRCIARKNHGFLNHHCLSHKTTSSSLSLRRRLWTTTTRTSRTIRRPTTTISIRQQRFKSSTNNNNTTKTPTKEEVVDKLHNVRQITKKLGVRLTKQELELLHKTYTKKKNSGNDYKALVGGLNDAAKLKLEERAAREICLNMVEKATTKWDHIGTNLIQALHFAGSALFAVVGTQIAGDAGMNIVGCTLVGCIAAMGGGTLNNLIYGASSTLLGRSGVFWVQMPSKLAGAIAASVVTFFVWPFYCDKTAIHYLRDVIGEENLEEDGTVGKQAFVEACHRDDEFFRHVRHSLPEKHQEEPWSYDPSHLFHYIDTDQSGTIDHDELKTLVQRQFDNSPITYALDTGALASLAVVGVHGALSRGFHPIVSCSSGVTVCFGGILRDVLCGRDLAVGGQSYAFATGTGAFVYVVLRQLAIYTGLPIPLIGRIFLSFGSTVGVRFWEYKRGTPLLSPMHGWHHAPAVGRRHPQNPNANPNATATTLEQEEEGNDDNRTQQKQTLPSSIGGS